MPCVLACHIYSYTSQASFLGFILCLSYVSRSLLWRLLTLFVHSASRAVGLAASGLPVLAFLLKFLEWWQSDEGTASRQAARSTTQLPIPPPPVNSVSTVLWTPFSSAICLEMHGKWLLQYKKSFILPTLALLQVHSTIRITETSSLFRTCTTASKKTWSH